MKRKYILPVLLIVQIIALKILALFPEFVETYYSNSFYAKLSYLERAVFGWMPFSFGDLLYGIVIFLVLRWFWKRRKTWREHWKDNVLRMISAISVFYFLFNFLWGVNYHRVRLADKLRINIVKDADDLENQYTDADLLIFTKKLIAKTNSIHLQLTKNDSVKVVFPYSQKEVFEKNVDGYAELATIYPWLAYNRPSIKKSLISLPLTYMGFAGYLNPFTNEAQVNDMMPMYAFPATASHEMAHQLGYASESEANFIGYLAVIKNKDLNFQYSGYAMALRYCLANWEVRDEKTFEALLRTVNPGIRKNFQESQQFWEQYETFLETGFKIFYDNFLKLNQQDEGLESYNRFVDFLVNYYKREKL